MTNRIYVDKLTSRSISFLLRHKKYTEIRVLEGKGIYFSICRLLLSVLKKKIEVEEFSLSTLRDSDGKCIFYNKFKDSTN